VRSTGVFASLLWAMTVNALCILPSFLVGALAVYIRGDLNFTDTIAGLSFSGFWLVASLCAIPSSRLVARIGTIRALHLASLITVVLCGAIAVFGYTQLPFVVLLVLAGCATSLATPAVNVRVMAMVSPGRQAFAITAAGASPVLSLMAAGLVAGVVGPVVGWRWIFAGVSVAMMLLSAARPRGIPALPSRPVRERGRDASAPRMFPLVRVMVLVGMANVAVGAATSFLVLAAPSARVESDAAALAVGIVSAASIAIRLAMASAVDRWRKDPLPLVVAMTSIGAVGFVLVGMAEPWSYFMGLVLILVPGWSWVGLLLFGVLARYRTAVAPASGVVQMVFFVGGVVGPVGMGIALSALPFNAAWWMLGALMVVAALGLFVGRRTLPAFESV